MNKKIKENIGCVIPICLLTAIIIMIINLCFFTTTTYKLNYPDKTYICHVGEILDIGGIPAFNYKIKYNGMLNEDTYVVSNTGRGATNQFYKINQTTFLFGDFLYIHVVDITSEYIKFTVTIKQKGN